ncbi:hypothetical protein ScalyP_jg555 [Parmales sp. scaly parma]|nr:hypothetical protein ScalyP_jg555 [Parmales sp. scaly parma]
MTTKMFSSGVLLTIADSLCQFIEHTNKNRRLAESFPTNDSTESSSTFTLDVSRLVRFSLMGAFFIAPATHHWYNYLTKVLPFPKPNTPHFVTTLKRVVLDQVAFAPFFIPAFFAALSTLEGKSVVQTIDKVKADTKPTYITNLGVWVPAQLVNFSVVPGRYQVLFSNFVGFFWNTYLSYVSNSKK